MSCASSSPPASSVGTGQHGGANSAAPPTSSSQGAPAGAGGALAIDSPENGTLFPPEIAPPLLRWHGPAGVARWRVSLTPLPGGEPVRAVVDQPQWRPAAADWTRLRTAAGQAGARCTVEALAPDGNTPAGPSGSVTFSFSSDPVGAPILYREVPLPFLDAAKDMSLIRWRLGAVDAAGPPPVVLEKLPVCGNCHTLSRDGRVLGMDVDYANDKGAYAVLPMAETLELSKDRILSWSSFRHEDGTPTFGLLSQVSPDGRYVISTVKDRSLFVPMPDFAYSQLFFPARGILAVYDLQTRRITALPGADDPAYVQSNATWSPDGKEIVFARAPVQQAVLEFLGEQKAPITAASDTAKLLEERYAIRYDLYRIPFNEGRGGVARPVVGASGNGKSNFFARFSPDGRWIVFCQASRAMLLQQDSRLWIVPAAGGTPRLLRANGPGMNSWHSFSPNGRWLVFSSKRNSPYTQLFLTHLDSEGNDSPAVLLDAFVSPDRAANIPEFANVRPGELKRITERFVDDYSHVRLALQLSYLPGEGQEKSIAECNKALALKPDSTVALTTLAGIRMAGGELPEAERLFQRVLELEPANGEALLGIGWVRTEQERLPEAEQALRKGLQAAPANALGHFNLAWVLASRQRPAEARSEFERCVQLAPTNARFRLALAQMLLWVGDPGAARQQLQILAAHPPDDPELHGQFEQLSSQLAQQGR